MPMPTPAGQFVWCELLARDPVASRAFYGAVVGWQMHDRPTTGMSYTVLMAGETAIGGLMTLPVAAQRGGLEPGWIPFVAVEDVDDAAVQVENLGGSIRRAATDIAGVGRFAVAASPDGAAFQLCQAIAPRSAVEPMIEGHVGWLELQTTDAPRALSFYGALFGWGKGAAFDLGPLGSYQQFTIGGAPAGGMFNSPAARQRAFWLIYFCVGNIDAATTRVVAAGGKILNGAHQVPGGAWIVQAADPEGARFALLGNRP
jgi:predicted enzyme related to lactoylglutathione lyase